LGSEDIPHLRFGGGFAYHVDGLWSSYWTAVDWGLTSEQECNASFRQSNDDNYNELVTAENTTLQLYPNPVIDVLEIRGAVSKASGSSHIRVYNLQGQLVKSISYYSGEQLMVDDLEGGVYMIYLSNESGMHMGKFMKL